MGINYNTSTIFCPLLSHVVVRLVNMIARTTQIIDLLRLHTQWRCLLLCACVCHFFLLPFLTLLCALLCAASCIHTGHIHCNDGGRQNAKLGQLPNCTSHLFVHFCCVYCYLFQVLHACARDHPFSFAPYSNQCFFLMPPKWFSLWLLSHRSFALPICFYLSHTLCIRAITISFR